MNSPVTVSARRKLDDWLSPILVKELRQGMRARAFVISFMLLQVFLSILVLGNVAAQDDRMTLETQNHFFWVIVGFALLILMPLRGLVTISTEVKNRTIETIMLTRMTAWRVVFGKWTALFAQSLLFGSAVLPYVVLRYFIGGNDVVSDFAWILFMLWLSGILIAGSIAVSGMGNAVVRIIVLVGAIVLVSIVVGNLDSAITRATSAVEVLGWLALFGFFVPALLFELTASSIAPASENHALIRRILALLFYGSSLLLEKLVNGSFQLAISIPLIVLVAICYFELAEKPRLLPRMIESFSRKGFLGKIAALFLLPGWPSALILSLVVIPLGILLAYPFLPTATGSDPGWYFLTMATLGSVLPPVLICHLFWSKNSQVLLMVVLYNLILLGISSLLEGLAVILNNTDKHLPVDSILSFLPSLPVLSVAMSANSNTISTLMENYFVGNTLVVSVLVIALLVASRRYHRDLFTLFRSGAKPASPTIAPALEQPTP